MSDAQIPEAPITAFERRFGHPPGLVVLFFTGMWERFSRYGVRGLLKLYMVNYLFVTLRQAVQGGAYVGSGDPGAVIGWRFIQDRLPAVVPEVVQRCITASMPRFLEGNAAAHVAPMTAEIARSVAEQTCAAAPHASMVYGAYVGFVGLAPLLGGLLADRYLGRRRAVIVGSGLLMIGYLFLAFDSAFFLALLLLILGAGAFTPNITTQVGDLYSRRDPRRDGALTLFYAGQNLGALICNLVCGTLAVVYGWHQAFAAVAVGMGIGLIIYVRGRKYLAPDAVERRGLPPPVDKLDPLAGRAWAGVLVIGFFVLVSVLFAAVNEQQTNAMQSWAEEQTDGLQGSGMLVFALGPLSMILFAPLLDLVWRLQARRGKPTSSASKMAFGWLLLGGSSLIMFVGARLVGADRGSVAWPLSCGVVLTIAELYFVPVGLSLVTRLSPVRIASTMMALWLMSAFGASLASGYLGVLFFRMTSEELFLSLTVVGTCVGVTTLACTKLLKRSTGIEA
jgi:POT family proton-dependent oligopeptide transporter